MKPDHSSPKALSTYLKMPLVGFAALKEDSEDSGIEERCC
jgi:hypothetical protein